MPILVIEVVSPSTRQRDLDRKRDFYMKAGIPDYWAVDPETRAIIRITPGSRESITSTLTWAPQAVAVVLEMDVAAMFDECLHRTAG